ncbi:hypothetical protein HanRHA438_Chr03g0141651 [Helianthus annuus]|nr:hypothetical protein HanRHA438_Chr03g0141651 [Helianthus annuus]KAJ0945332.1 hypothetical protein HanPSC8_Chr03g0126991 [Helianthus annuus]
MFNSASRCPRLRFDQSRLDRNALEDGVTPTLNKLTSLGKLWHYGIWIT